MHVKRVSIVIDHDSSHVPPQRRNDSELCVAPPAAASAAGPGSGKEKAYFATHMIMEEHSPVWRAYSEPAHTQSTACVYRRSASTPLTRRLTDLARHIRHAHRTTWLITTNCLVHRLTDTSRSCACTHSYVYHKAHRCTAAASSPALPQARGAPCRGRRGVCISVVPRQLADAL